MAGKMNHVIAVAASLCAKPSPTDPRSDVHGVSVNLDPENSFHKILP